MEKQVKAFTLINAAELLKQEFEPLQFAVEKILPHGLFILAGSGKIGKSWLALDMCTAVSSGGRLWDFHAEQGEVLYLALEDNQARLQGRLNKIEAEETNIKRLHLVTAAFGINSGLIEQTHNHLTAYPDTKLIIIDTLERIRDTEQDKSMYSCDYRDMNALRSITDKHKLTLLLIHHTRKMYDPDPLNTLSGSTGLIGSVDGVFVLEKEKRTSNAAKLTIANRDTEGFCFRLEFDPDNCKWSFIGNDSDFADEETEENDELLLSWVDKFLRDEWSGTATVLCDGLKRIDPAADVFPKTITKRLKGSKGYFKKNGIDIVFVDRDREKRGIKLSRQGEA